MTHELAFGEGGTKHGIATLATLTLFNPQNSKRKYKSIFTSCEWAQIWF